MTSKSSSNKMLNKSPKFEGLKKLSISPYSRPPSTQRTSKTIQQPINPSTSGETTKEYICMICLDYLQPNNTNFTSCGHMFHQHCLKGWYKNVIVKSCPLCRNDKNFYDNSLRSIQPQSGEDKHEDFAEYADFESLRQSVMTSIFKLWPLSTMKTYQPKELLDMAYRSLDCSQKVFKAGHLLQAYRLLRRSMHFCDGIQFCVQLNNFMKQYGTQYSSLETHLETLNKSFDLKFSTFLTKTSEFQEHIYSLEQDFSVFPSTFTFSL